MSGRTVLTWNAGSSSLKFGLFRSDEALASGEAEAIGGSDRRLTIASSGKTILDEKADFTDEPAAARRIADFLAGSDLPAPQAIGHRIVHGGPNCIRHALITPEVQGYLEHARAFAPLHVPVALALIGFSQERFAGLPQVACLDTDFHADLPDVARTLPLPAQLAAEGVHRYGFHGLSCELIVGQLGNALPERLVIAHLGSGASITAVRAGRSIDTSMGLTPSGGILMGTRTGDLDPGVMLYLLREKSLDPEALEALLDRRSGLLGISGLSNDIRQLRAAAPQNGAAQLALDMFAYAVRKQVAAMAAALGGLDLLVFTGGIGEHDAGLRDSVSAGLAWAGFEPSQMRVLPSDEDRQIALHTARLAFGETLRL